MKRLRFLLPFVVGCLISMPAALSAAPRSGGQDKPQSDAAAKKSDEPKPDQAKSDPAKSDQAKPSDAAKDSSATANDDAPPAAESPFGVTIDVGSRWVGTIHGDPNTYRSLVNLGEGVRLNHLDLHYQKPLGKLVDSFFLQANNWGGDPYNTARVDAGKQGLYRFVGNYSNIAYFNYLPSFANPTQPYGFNQRAYDTAIRNISNELQILPNSRFSPYVAYERNTSYGNGITTLVATGNEYPLHNLVHWGQDTYRGGVKMDFTHAHVTVEHGGIVFKDDQQVYSTEGNYGNRPTLYLGRQLFLSTGAEAYAVRGDGRFTKVLFSSNPYSWVDLYGQVLYSNPQTNANYLNTLTGNNYVIQDSILFYSTGTDLIYGNANRPHTSGTFSMEVRPLARLRVREIFETDRIKTDTNAAFASTYVNTLATTLTSSTAIDRFESSYNRQSVEALYDITRRITLRGGYRYEWGDSLFRSSPLDQNDTIERFPMKRHVGIGGIIVRPITGLTINADAEASNGVRTYFRTGLQDYFKVRVQGRYQIRPDLHINVMFLRFENDYPVPETAYKYTAQTATAGLQWMPGNSKYISILADYSHSFVRSDISYIIPNLLQSAVSQYRDFAHTGTVVADLTLPLPGVIKPKLTAGGSFVRTSGSRPSQYYQPLGRLSVPLTRRISLYSEWRWYELNQPYYLYEGFRSHMVMSGVRFTM